MTIEDQALKQWKIGLSKRGLVIDSQEILARCISMSESFHWEMDTFLNKYEAFTLGTKLSNINEVNIISNQNLSDFLAKERNEASNKGITKLDKRPSSVRLAAAMNSNEMNDMLDTFGGGSYTSSFPHSSIPQLNKDSMARSEGDPSLSFSSTPTSMKMGLRRKNNTTVATKCLLSFNVHLPNFSSAPSFPETLTPEIASFEHQIESTYRHLFVKMGGKARDLNTRLETFASRFDHEWSHPGIPSSEPVFTYGRLVADMDEGKWNEKSVLLETSRSLASGMRVKLILNEIGSYSLFPGQFVAIEGMATFDGFHVKRFLSSPSLERPLTHLQRLKDSKGSQQPLKIVIAAGPFWNSTSEDEYSSLDRLLDHCSSHCIQLLILLGPFINEEAALRDDSEKDDDFITYEEMFISKLSHRLNGFTNSRTQCCIVPSLKDAFHQYSFPQPPFQTRLLGLDDSIISLPSPCFAFVNEFVIGISNVDILFDISCQEIAKTPAEASSDRMSRLIKHAFEQRSFYPLFPPGLHTNIDYSHSMQLNLQLAPDLLIIPSQLRYFVKSVEDVVCINPGQFIKGSSMGTFAEVLIQPLNLSSATEESGQTLDLIPNLLDKRVRVDISQF